MLSIKKAKLWKPPNFEADLTCRTSKIALESNPSNNAQLNVHFTCRSGNHSQLKYLLNFDIDVNQQDSEGRTAIHCAISSGCLQTVKQLIDYQGINLNAQTFDGTTPLILAAKLNQIHILDLLLIIAPVKTTLTDNTGKSALHWAAAIGSVQCVESLLCQSAIDVNELDKYNQNALFLAAREGHATVCQHLLVNGANKEIVNIHNKNAIDIASDNKHENTVFELQMDFFALQADKHGPEILLRLQSIGGKPLSTVDAKEGPAEHSGGKGQAEKPGFVPPPPAPERNVSVIQRNPNFDRPDPPKKQKRKVPQGQRTNQQQSDHLVCQVCGERAGKHSYYGGQVGGFFGWVGGATKKHFLKLGLVMTYIVLPH